VRVESLKTKHRPDPDDDEFAKSAGDYRTAEDLRNAIRRDLEAHKKEHARQQTRDALLQWLQDNNEFEVPEILVEHQIQARLGRLMQDLYRQGINPRGLDIDWSKIRRNQRENAVRDVRGSLILDHLAAREGIAVSDGEIDEKIAGMAESMRQPEARVREILGKDGGIDRIRGQIRNDKVFALLEDQAKIHDAGSLSKAGGGE
jgi:trigger factor